MTQGMQAAAIRAKYSPLVQPLFEGPIDVIGDVHGEIETLTALMTALGYDSEGVHPEGRRLVFVGDLCDRGPDSPGVVRWVQRLVEAGRAQAVAGNHELNILRREKKHGNDWFFGSNHHHEFGSFAAIAKHEQDQILNFLRTLPIALERSDLRIVHAAWIPEAIDQCRAANLTLDEAFTKFEEEMKGRAEYPLLKAQAEEEMARYQDVLSDRNAQPPAQAIGPYDEFCQMNNPIRIITSGVEKVSSNPFFANDKWRYVDRVPWWDTYEDEIPVLFGHYWRWWNPTVHKRLSKGEPQLFDDPIGPFMADHHRAFCIDFSVGGRYKQRAQNHEPPYHGRLAAMRWPERTLVYDGEAPLAIPE